jgi:RNA polymerase sigma-70 factor (ECF subfamily)
LNATLRTTEVGADERLMSAVQNGDRESFGRLVARHKVPIVNFLYRYTLDRDLAEDLAQEVFLRVFREARSFDPLRGKATTWIYTVARNLARDVARRKKFELKANSAFCERRGRLTPADMATSLDDDPVSALERKETMKAVRSSLARLPEKYRAVFVLCELQELSYQDVGAVVGCSEKTVSSRLSRARDRFRREMEHFVGTRR